MGNCLSSKNTKQRKRYINDIIESPQFIDILKYINTEINTTQPLPLPPPTPFNIPVSDQIDFYNILDKNLAK